MSVPSHIPGRPLLHQKLTRGCWPPKSSVRSCTSKPQDRAIATNAMQQLRRWPNCCSWLLRKSAWSAKRCGKTVRPYAVTRRRCVHVRSTSSPARAAAASPPLGWLRHRRRRGSKRKAGGATASRTGSAPARGPRGSPWGGRVPAGGAVPGLPPVGRGARDRPREEEGCNSSARRSKAKNVPAVGKRSRAIRPLPMSSGIIAPVSKRGSERCNTPRPSRPATALGQRPPAPRGGQEAPHWQGRCEQGPRPPGQAQRKKVERDRLHDHRRSHDEPLVIARKGRAGQRERWGRGRRHERAWWCGVDR